MLNRVVYLIITVCLFLIGCQAKTPKSQSSDIADKKFGIISVPVANLRENPAHSSQLVDQEIMGYTVKLLEQQDYWYKVQTEYGYIGWMTDKSFQPANETELKKWKACEKIRVSKVFATVYSQPDENSVPVTSAQMNALLQRIGTDNEKWLKINTPDGRIGFLKSENTAARREKLTEEQLRQAIIETAQMMMGVPYLWGGKSSTANDCSGFTQTVFRANGINILRDAYQQANEGTTVDYKDDFSNVMPGDLIFFGKDKVIHVGISLVGGKFIHQRGCVHINSLDPNAADYSDSDRKILKAVRRVY